MKFSNLPILISYLWNSKKIWRRPENAKVLIVDRVGSENLLTYLNPASVEIMELRGESLNIYVLFKCFLQWKLTKINYMVQYLKCVKPILAITFIDNNRLFYQLKSHLKDLITVLVQNGIRGEPGDIFSVLKRQKHLSGRYQVDYMLIFGNAIGRKYSKYIDGKIFPIGSFKNNLLQLKTIKASKSVLFISQYRHPPSDESKPLFMQGNKPIFWKDVRYSYEVILPLLQKYCMQNKLKLKICGNRADNTKKEYEFFRAIIGNEAFEFLERRDVYSSYEYVNAAEFVVFFESTLGYEALSRGKRAVAFRVYGEVLLPQYNFGWPAILPDKGPFWTNHSDESEFKRVMDYITSVSDEEWEQMHQRYFPELMEYDPGNSRFLKLMRELCVPLKKEYT
jgi:surface carbohydrate biosynthesis protein